MNYNELCDTLANYISRISNQSIKHDTSLLDTGAIDSFNVLEIITFIEERLKIQINVDDISIRNFANVESLATWVFSNHN